MNKKQFRKLLQDHNGWVDGEFLRFPSPWLMEKFFKEVDALSSKKET